MIPEKSIPNFYEWSVTSALEKALQKNDAAFRVTGFNLNAKNFDGGVTFWSMREANYFKYLYAGPTDALIITTTTALALSQIFS